MTQTRREIERRALELIEQRHDPETRLPEREWAALLAQESVEVRARYGELTARSQTADFEIHTVEPSGGESRLPPATVGHFRLISRIGHGGMGQVWLAQRSDGLFDQRVAIKLIHEDRFSPRALDRFEAERRILARLEHPAIARLIDGGISDDGQPWLAMEYVEGDTLDTYLGRVKPRTRERVGLFIQLCEAVQSAHARFVVHADLKPPNILVDHSGRVRLLDFGIARLISQESDEGPLPLTRAYSSPQRLKGQSPTVSDDVYALGLLLGEITKPDADADLAAIIARASADEDLARYGSAEALANDLKRWLNQEPVSAQPATRSYRTRLFFKRHRVASLLTLSALAILTVSTVTASLSYFKAEAARHEAQQRFDQTRSMARFMMFDLYDQLSDAPGTVAARSNIANLGGRYLDSLSQTPDADNNLLVEAARGYLRVATIEGISGTANLGHVRDAKQALDQAEVLLRRVLKRDPVNAGALEEMGWLAGNRWTLGGADAESARLLPQARQFYLSALKLEPDRPGAQLGYLINEKNVAYDLIWQDQPKRAIPVVKAALAKLESFPWPPNRREDADLLKVNLLNRYGDAVYYSGDLAGSESYYRQADLIAQQWLGRTPGSLVWNHRRGEILWNLGGVLGELGRHREALDVLQTGVTALEKVAAYGPDASVEKMLVILLGQKAETLMQLGRPQEAIEPARRSLDIRRARLAKEPSDQARQRDVPVALVPYAKVLAAAGDRQGACAAAVEAVKRWQDLSKAGQTFGIDVRRNLPDTVKLKADVCS
jgi:tetratricopeptide (TPR) repeat protein